MTRFPINPDTVPAISETTRAWSAERGHPYLKVRELTIHLGNDEESTR